MEFYDLMAKAAEDVGLELTTEQYDQFITYMRLLQEWNEKINLVNMIPLIIQHLFSPFV